MPRASAGNRSGVPPVERANRVRGDWTEREIRLGGARVGIAAVWRAEQAGARRGARVRGEGDRDERVTDYAIDSRVLDHGWCSLRRTNGAASACGTPRGHRTAAGVDRAHERLSGPATRRIMQREYEQYGKKEYQRLAQISVSHLYNLRGSACYRNQAAVFEATRPTAIAIGERRRPEPQGARISAGGHGASGRLGRGQGRVSHQRGGRGDAMASVGCASKISEACLLPVLQAVLAQFPFTILGFHADNGSEYINHRVAKLLAKLQAEFTKSRACAVRTTRWWKARTGR